MADSGGVEADLQDLQLSSSSTEYLTESTEDTRALLTPHYLSSDVDASGQGSPVIETPPAVSKWQAFKQYPVTRALWSWWRTLVVVLPPLLLLPLPLLWEAPASRALYIILIMAVYWVTEVVPIAATALLPLVLFPALGVLPADNTARNYLKDSNMLFVGGLMMAVAIERWNLHKRMALLVLMLVGSKPKWLLLGFMGTTGFLSMWISNTATAAMMLPIAQAVLLEIKEEAELEPDASILGRRSLSADETVTPVRYTRRYDSTAQLDNNDPSLPMDGGRVTFEPTKTVRELSTRNGYRNDGRNAANRPASVPDKQFDRLAKSLMLGVAYAANIGGTGTLTGTGPNIVLAGLASDLGINFGLWFVFAAPAMLLALALSWLYLSAVYCDDSFQKLKQWLFKWQPYSFNGQRAKTVIREQYKKLGRVRYAEMILIAMFALLVLLWLFREPGFIPGWGSFFSEDTSHGCPGKQNDAAPKQKATSYVSDATAVLAIVSLLFIIPSEPCCCSWQNFLKAGSSPRLLDWDFIQRKLPWNVIILLGSGFAIADAAENSGLSDWIGERLTVFEDLPREVIALSISFLVASFTEVVSNVATATLLLPILRVLGEKLCIHPLYLMIPATVSASYAFMVPVATPPNAIAFSYGYIKVYNMVATGVFMNLLCVGIVTLALNTTGVFIFGLNSPPGNETYSCNRTDIDNNFM